MRQARQSQPGAWLPAYHLLLDNLVTTACVLTTHYDGRDSGSLVTSVMPCNLRDERFLVATWHESLTHELLRASRILVLNLIAANQTDLVELFGKRSGRWKDKFQMVSWTRGITGAPVLADCLGYVEGRVIKHLVCGDHTAHLVVPVQARWTATDVRPLLTTDIRSLGIEAPHGSRRPPS